MRRVALSMAGFLILFCIYHSAEYMILYKNNALAFLAISVAFFVAAFVISRWQGFTGLSAVGIIFNRRAKYHFIVGLGVGLTLNSLMVSCLSLLDIEAVSFIPSTKEFILQASILTFGTFFSSLTEDILTRGYLFSQLEGKVGKITLVLVSAIVYVFNHIHRLDEPIYLVYLFVMGVQLMIPLVMLRNIWYTFGVHWAGNIIYHITNNVMRTSSGSSNTDPMIVAILFIALLVPVNYFVCKTLMKIARHKDLVIHRPLSVIHLD